MTEHNEQGSKRRVKIGRRASYREGALFGILTFGLVAGLALISSVLNSRIYGVKVIGEYALAMATVAAVRLTSTTKERPALVRELTLLEPRHPRVTGLFWATITFSTVLTCVIGAIAVGITQLLLSGPISAPGILLPTAVNVAGYALFGNTGENIDVVFNGFRAGRQQFQVRVEMAVMFLVISVVLGLMYGTLWGLIAGTVGSQFTGLIHRLFLVPRFMRFRASRSELRAGFRTLPGLIRFGLKITPGALADGGANESGTWIVASFGTIADVGAYGRAYLLIKQLLVLNVRTSEMLLPTLLERRAKGDGAGYARALIDSLRYTTMTLLLPAAAAGGVAKAIMHIFGGGFERGSGALAVLLLVPPLSSLSQIQRIALLALNRPWYGTFCGLARFGVTIVAGILLCWKLGAIGAAFALVLGFLVDLGCATRVVARHLDTPFRTLWPARQWFGQLAAYGAGFGISALAAAPLPFPLNCFVGLLAGSVAFLAVLAITGSFNERDRARLRDGRAMIAKRLGRKPKAPLGPGLAARGS